MSEYWKSTASISAYLPTHCLLTLLQPKYWCKHCKTFIRDTKLEKANHEATPKHQGNLKRFLRDLHRGHEKDEKDKERAKAEVARLNGVVRGESSASSSGFGRGPTPFVSKPPATAAQRKQQLAQLAELGVAVPDEFLPDLAIAGQWQVTETRIIGVDEGDKKPDAVALGVRKRAVEEDEEEAEANKRRWGSAYRLHPSQEDDADLDALLNNAIGQGKGKAPATKKESNDEIKLEIEEEPNTAIIPELTRSVDSEATKASGIKSEVSDGSTTVSEIPPLDGDRKDEEGPATVVFKKRKAKNIRQK